MLVLYQNLLMIRLSVSLYEHKIYPSLIQCVIATDDVGVSRGGPEVAVASASEGVSRSLSTPSKFRRLRTSFKQQQLRLMKTYFSLNHNPDSKAIKSLANKTGLDERVLQVDTSYCMIL